MNLFEINAKIREALEAAIEPETGEIIDDLAIITLDALTMEFDAKIEAIALYIKESKAEAEAIKAEKIKLQARQSAAEHRAERLTNYLQAALAGEKFATPKVVISYRKSEAVELQEGFSVYDIDTHFLRAKDPELDKTAIKAAIKAGELVDGVQVIQKTSMIIK